ncbi:MAG: Putative signal transduction histidine kinase, partial [uncultured Pseudonocardia sp.]
DGLGDDRGAGARRARGRAAVARPARLPHPDAAQLDGRGRRHPGPLRRPRGRAGRAGGDGGLDGGHRRRLPGPPRPAAQRARARRPGRHLRGDGDDPAGAGPGPDRRRCARHGFDLDARRRARLRARPRRAGRAVRVGGALRGAPRDLGGRGPGGRGHPAHCARRRRDRVRLDRAAPPGPAAGPGR